MHGTCVVHPKEVSVRLDHCHGIVLGEVLDLGEEVLHESTTEETRRGSAPDIDSLHGEYLLVPVKQMLLPVVAN